MTLDEIVRDYIREHRDDARREMRFFAIQRDTYEAIHKAALCELPSGKRHSHQCRIPKAALKEAERGLQRISRKLSAAPDFAALHDLIEARIGGIRGIGALTVYDIAHRIGAHFGKAPKRVYLHAGTKVGARSLGASGRTVDPKLLPKSLSRLEPSEIEDCLCIYKDAMQGRRYRCGGSGCAVDRPKRACS
jgi:hypothetical protein